MLFEKQFSMHVLRQSISTCKVEVSCGYKKMKPSFVSLIINISKTRKIRNKPKFIVVRLG